MHCNDSRDTFDSGADRHANLGAGQIDPDLLAGIVRDAGAPVVCETPGPAERTSPTSPGCAIASSSAAHRPDTPHRQAGLAPCEP